MFVEISDLFFIKNKKLNYNISISILNIYSALCCSSFCSNYVLKSSWVWCYKFGKPVFGDFLKLFSADPLKLYQFTYGVSEHISGLCRNVWPGSCLGSGCATQGHSKLRLRHLGYLLKVAVRLECKSSPKSDVHSTLEQAFIKDLTALSIFLTLTSLPVFAAVKPLHHYGSP